MRSRVRATAVAAAAAAALMVSACGGGNASGAAEGPAGDPVAGGVGHVIEVGEPASLDPAVIHNTWSRSPIIGNALYGQLLVDDPKTGELEPKLLESFSSGDGGATFTVTVKQGVVFSDGSPFTAEAIKFGWDRMKDPTTGSSGVPQASLVKSIEVKDERTLVATLVEPIPNFPQVVVTTMNWIGKPDILKQGRAAVDDNPIGAGPFVLEKWTRQSVVALTRNDRFWDAPRPYLDRLEVRPVSDPAQRINAMVSGQAELAMEGSYENLAKAQESGLHGDAYPLSGGVGFAMNTSKAPFDDVRARNAVSYALDLDAFNQAVFGGYGQIPKEFFVEGTPFYRDIPLHTFDPKKAQALFDELAAEGKPVTFSMSFFPTTSKEFEAIQAQLSQYKNVTIDARQRDLSEAVAVMLGGDFDMVSTLNLSGAEPDPRVWLFMHGRSRSGNFTRINDPELNAALDAGRTATDVKDRAEAYAKVQEKLAALTPYIFYNRSGAGVIYNSDIHGVTRYGLGSLSPETLWIKP